MASLNYAMEANVNRYLAAHGDAQRLRMKLGRSQMTENALVMTVEARWVDAPEVEQRIGARYLQREGD